MRHWLVTALYEAGWTPVAVFALHGLASRVLGLYVTYPPSDIAMHVLGGIAIAWFFWRCAILASRAGVIGALNRVGLAVLVFGLTCAAAVGWEFAAALLSASAGLMAGEARGTAVVMVSSPKAEIWRAGRGFPAEDVRCALVQRGSGSFSSSTSCLRRGASCPGR